MVRPVTEDDIGLKTLYDVLDETPETDLAAIVDIIAIHGIGAHPDDTWCKKVGDGVDQHYVNWLQDMLPAAVSNTRILRYGYESQWFGDNAISTKVPIIAKRLLEQLKLLRVNCPDRPLIFIAHCFGGLVVLKTIVEAKRAHLKWPGIYTSTVGMMFFGTPFRGAGGMDQTTMLKAALSQYAEEQIQIANLNILAPGNEMLVDLMDTFMETRQEKHKTPVVCFFEQKRSNVGRIVGGKDKLTFLVDESAGCLDPSEATEKHSMSRNHFDMNKFGRRTEEDFLVVRKELVKMVEQGPELLQVRSELRTPLQKYYEVPSIQVSDFIGREDLLETMKFDFSNRSTTARPKILVLQALGGQGKTQLALEYCRRSKTTFRGIFWIDATSQSTAEKSIELIANKLNSTHGRILRSLDSKIEFVKSSLEEWDDYWMLVFDNYDQPSAFTNIKTFIPSGGHGVILFTSRHEATKRLGKLIKVPPMTNDEGLRLLLRQYSIDDIKLNYSEGSKILQRLGNLALAIDQAAAYISYKAILLSEFLPEFEAQREKVLQYTPKYFWEYKKFNNDTEKERSINAYTTWEMSFQQIAPDNSRRKRNMTHFLTLSAFLEASNIGEYLFRYFQMYANPIPEWIQIFRSSYDETDHLEQPNTSSFGKASFGPDVYPELKTQSSNQKWNSELYWDLLRELQQLSLLESSTPKLGSAGAQFSLHPLIRDWLQLRKVTDRQEFTKEAIKLITILLDSDLISTADLERKQEILAHIDTCVSNDKQFLKENGFSNGSLNSEAESFSEFYSTRGRWDEAERLQVTVLETRKRTLGEKHLDTLTSMAHLASTYQSQGRWGEAEGLQVTVLETTKRTLGEEHPDTLRSMGNLACTYRNQGRWGEAEGLQVTVLEAMKRVRGDEHPDTLRSMGNLAGTYQHQGRWGEAEGLEVTVLETTKRILGEEHPDTLTSMGNLACTYRDQGRCSEAEGLQVTVLEAMKRTLGEEHLDTLRNMAHLAGTYQDQGRWGEAEGLQMTVLETTKRTLGDEHPDTLSSMANLACTYQSQGRWSEAEGLEVRVLETRKPTLGDEHPDTLTSMGNLAGTYQSQGRWSEAEGLEVTVLETSKRTFGDEHPDTLSSMANLACTYRSQGRWGEAKGLEVTVLETRKRTLGDEHPDTLRSMGNLAGTYQHQGRWGEAEGLQVTVLETRKRTLGDEHPDTLRSMGNLASTYRNQGRYGEAERLEVRVLETRKRTLGDEHPDTLRSMACLACTYRNQGRWGEAEGLNVRALETMKRTLGDEHPDTLRSMANLAGTYRDQDRWGEAEGLEVRVLETSKRTFGDEHPDTLSSMANLAVTYSSQDRWDEAEGLEVRVLETRKRTLGDEHPDTLTSMANLASTYSSQGRWDEAEGLEVRVLETRKRTLGDEHPDTLRSMANLACTYWNQDRWGEAEGLEVRVLEMSKCTLGEEHPDTLRYIGNLASTYGSQGRWDEAEGLDVTVLETRKRTLREEHPDTLRSKGILAGMLYAKPGRMDKLRNWLARRERTVRHRGVHV
ncbi:MAG: hypothetical protein M1824_005022 [Vezdaea acicularis]|nr:MAG: hypothetical protein M1824_005022 [Vezdaea acicularis]